MSRRRSWRPSYRQIYPYLLIAPALIVLAIVLVYPFISGVLISFQRDTLMSQTRPFIGLENYRTLFQIPQFGLVLRTSLVWTFGCVVGEAVLGVLVALVLNRSFRGRGIFRALLLIPWVMPSVVAAVIWRWLYHAEFGVVNLLFAPLGLFPAQENWLGDPNTALWAVMLTNIWRGFPFWMIMTLAGLQAIDLALYEAARVDGAHGLQLFRYITLPNLRLVLTITSILSFVGNFNNFTLIYAMTEGGPVNSTKIMPIFIWEDAFKFTRFGEAAAMATFLAVIMALAVLVYARALRIRSREA
ncbi:MAG: sugar ABC transporter permease [Candidatus Dormibacteraeota bacterium]|nr:sugar ABC transporter permease [Candidatus Dormibacteraeota bacterium]